MIDYSATAEKLGRTPGSIARRPGSLVILGSGIKAINHFTLEAQAYLEWADAVYFCVADPATEQWILQKKPQAIDLYQYYANDKMRINTYVQMAEVMLRSVRKGLNVVGIFYGHPGVFVNPSHRAIAIARGEGHEAFMAPAVSALDCLFCDLGIDPSVPGCQIFEATDLVLRRRLLAVDSHVVIFQPGSVGNAGFNFAGFSNDHLDVLIRYLQDAYGEDHEIINYVASQYAISEPIIQRVALSSLLEPETQKIVTGISTFYIPPKGERPIDPQSLKSFGLGVRAPLQGVSKARVQIRSGNDSLRREPVASRSAYTERELRVIDQLESHEVPAEYRPCRPSPEMYRVIEELSLNPTSLELFLSNPHVFLRGHVNLSTEDRAALLTRHYGLLRKVMRRSTAEVAQVFVQRALRDSFLCRRYTALIQANSSKMNGRDSVTNALRDLGYDTTPEDVFRAFENIQHEDLKTWAGMYELVVDKRPCATLTVGLSGVRLGPEIIEGYQFSGGVLSWTDDSGNESSGSLCFFLLTSRNGEPLSEEYVGPQFRGTIWPKGAKQPSRENASGKVGVFSAESALDALASDPLHTWVGRYLTNVSLSTSSNRDEPSFVIRPINEKIELEVAGKVVDSFVYRNGYLSWTQPEPEYSGTILLYRDGEVDGRAAFVGRIWQRVQEASFAINAFGKRINR